MKLSRFMKIPEDVRNAVESIARATYRRYPYVGLDDLRQEGYMVWRDEILKGKWDPSLGIAYLKTAIQNELVRFVSKEKQQKDIREGRR